MRAPSPQRASLSHMRGTQCWLCVTAREHASSLAATWVSSRPATPPPAGPLVGAFKLIGDRGRGDVGERGDDSGWAGLGLEAGPGPGWLGMSVAGTGGRPVGACHCAWRRELAARSREASDFEASDWSACAAVLGPPTP